MNPPPDSIAVSRPPQQGFRQFIAGELKPRGKPVTVFNVVSLVIIAVAVVPMFAPMISGTAFSRLIRPCWTKMIARPVVTELDWRTAVTRAPTRMASRARMVNTRALRSTRPYQ